VGSSPPYAFYLTNESAGCLLPPLDGIVKWKWRVEVARVLGGILHNRLRRLKRTLSYACRTHLHSFPFNKWKWPTSHWLWSCFVGFTAGINGTGCEIDGIGQKPCVDPAGSCMTLCPYTPTPGRTPRRKFNREAARILWLYYEDRSVSI
jgi:hypothetical protein